MTVEKKVLTKEEIAKLQNLKTKFVELTSSIGEVEINMMAFQNKKENLKKQLSELNKEEMIIAKELQNKYGQGNISLENGRNFNFPGGTSKRK